MLGIEIVHDQQTRKPASELRDRIVNLAFARNVLLPSCGESSLRLSPPLLVKSKEAVIAMDVLQDCIEPLSWFSLS